MKILFLTIARINNISERHIYTDLIRKFRDEGHELYIVSTSERRNKEKTNFSKIEGVNLLSVWTLNAQKTSLLEKGLCTLFIDNQFLKAIKKYFSNIYFDLILYSTPPITLTNTIAHIKKRDRAITYLLLKDIFPQNAVDLGMFKKSSFLYSYFRKKEKKLYEISDFIGCLSPANVDYVLKHNQSVNPGKIEINPNTLSPVELNFSIYSKSFIRKKYNIPSNAIVFVYGGNIGKPQGIDFILKILSKNIGLESIFFVIVGSGTEFPRIFSWYKKEKPNNILVLPGMSKLEYDELLTACDVGLIFLDNRFTIPNIPARLLSYLENKMPVLAATDINTDIGKIIEDAGCGFWVQSNNINAYNECLQKFIIEPNIIEIMGNKSFELLNKNYTIDITYKKVIEKLYLKAKNK
jgi:glycosyltransferase involved in cell wall biosynthesis